MSDITLLSEADLRACVALDLPSIEAIEQAFVLLATAAVAMPPILRLDIPEHNGEVDVKTAYLPGLERFAIKVSPGFFDNRGTRPAEPQRHDDAVVGAHRFAGGLVAG
ncbi:ornithine cyclodeaminase/alanine dehydrogenase-like protein (mu-crystallin family) [Pseudomonas silensiensis]|nr:ornithine cyclodeaminase/alanine dehydrogenase-like protein (mu-crystallin family) [Pseudomonas silensiensis]